MPKEKEEVKEEQDIVATPAEEEAVAEAESVAEEVPVEAVVADISVETDISEVKVDSEGEISDLEFPPPQIESDGTVTVQPVKFASFEDSGRTQGESNKNLDILMDIKLQLTVELGRTELPIKKVLELTRGSIIELEKVAGEPVELYANGKLVAHGEVVVIEDNFGLRITNITDPEDRLKGLP